MRARYRILSALAGVMALAGQAFAGPLSIEANKTEPLRFKRPVASIVIGNPLVADVAIFNEQMVFITGKSYGTTNIMAFDAAGNLIYSNDVAVSSPTESLLRVVRGDSVNSYDCTPACRSIMNPGDEQDYFDNVLNQNRQLSRAARE